MRNAGSLALLIIAGCYFSACTTARYQRTLGGTHKVKSKGGTPSNNLKGDFSMTRQTVELSDQTGVVCAALVTAGSASAAREQALKDAHPGQQTIEYKYQVTAASQYAGFTCGAYWSWGRSNDLDVTGGQRVEQTGHPGHMLFGEGGFRFGFRDADESGLSYGAHLDFAYGGWRTDGLEQLDNAGVGPNPTVGLKRRGRTTNYLRVLTTLDLTYAPVFAYGFGLFGTLGLDALLYKSPNFGAGASYVAAITKKIFFEVDLYAQREVSGKYKDYTVDSRELIGRGMFWYNF